MENLDNELLMIDSLEIKTYQFLQSQKIKKFG